MIRVCRVVKMYLKRFTDDLGRDGPLYNTTKQQYYTEIISQFTPSVQSPVVIDTEDVPARRTNVRNYINSWIFRLALLRV
jgi:hypothetical protein